MSIGRNLILRISSIKWIERVVKRSFLFRPLVRRFIAGDTLAESMSHAEDLCNKDLMVSLDYLGENTKSEAEANAACDTYIAMLERIAQSEHSNKINISIKLTQCGLDQGVDFAEMNYRRVLDVAAKLGIFVRVDMESSDYTERTIEMIQRVLPDFPLTGTVLQSYLYRSLKDTEAMIAIGARVRVVKGAYLEPAEVAMPEKAEVDKNYLAMSELLLSNGNYPAIATHDEKIITTLKAYVEKMGIEKSSFEWQMLYGIRRDLQDSLRKEKYNVRVYVPFGDSWYPYFTRRLAERPANGMFILKSLFKR